MDVGVAVMVENNPEPSVVVSRREVRTPCPFCGADAEDRVPVWEGPDNYERGAEPDYIGCTACNTMETEP